jgi:hypothetical protein
MQIQEISKINDSLFFKFTDDRKLEYFFYLMDYKQYPEKTKLFMATDEENKIHGLFIIWQNHTIQLRGSVEAVKLFLDYLGKEKVVINSLTGTTNHQEILEQKFPDPPMQFNMYRMALKKGDENL